MSRPRVSVCIPTYNGGRFLAAAIGSVLAQERADMEVLVVDDASEDDTVEIARSFADPRLSVHRNEERRGIPANWNRCLELARGEFVNVFHQDDVMLPGNLESKIELLAGDRRMSFVHSAIELLVEASAVDQSWYWVDRSDRDFTADGMAYFRKLYLSDNLVCAPAVVARRRILMRLGGFDESLGFTPDYEMWLRLCVEGRVGFLSRPLIRYRWHSANVSVEYRGDKGLGDVKQARLQAARHYAARTGRRGEGEILLEAAETMARLEARQRELEAAVAELAALRAGAGELARAKARLEEQQASWQETAEKQRETLEAQRATIGELDSGREWLESERAKWQEVAEEQGRLLEEQRRWMGELERAKTWLEQERARWQEEAEEQARRPQGGEPESGELSPKA